jgi:hypothetical protein
MSLSKMSQSGNSPHAIKRLRFGRCHISNNLQCHAKYVPQIRLIQEFNSWGRGSLWINCANGHSIPTRFSIPNHGDQTPVAESNSQWRALSLTWQIPDSMSGGWSNVKKPLTSRKKTSVMNPETSDSAWGRHYSRDFSTQSLARWRDIRQKVAVSCHYSRDDLIGISGCRESLNTRRSHNKSKMKHISHIDCREFSPILTCV